MCYRADYCLYSKVNRNETTVDIVNPVFRRTPLEHVVPRDTLYVEERKKGEMDGEEEEEKEEEEEEGARFLLRFLLRAWLIGKTGNEAKGEGGKQGRVNN